MPSTGRIVLATLGGLVLGSVVNTALITIGGYVIPVPEGADVSSAEGLAAAMALFTPRHYLFPWLAHAGGTLAGAAVGTAIVGGASRVPAGVIGGLFLAGGASMVLMVPSPLWFTAADLLLAYVPMAALGYLLIARRRVRG